MLGNLIRFNEPTGFEWQASAGDGFLQSPAGAAARREGGKELCVKDVETLSKRQAVRPTTHVAAFTSLFFVFLFFLFEDVSKTQCCTSESTPTFQRCAHQVKWQQLR